MLKKLSLRACPIPSNEILFGFLTNCPLLEEFSWTSDVEDVEIELDEGELVELFKCLPSVQVLEIFMDIEDLGAGSMPHKLPISLPHLRILVLGVCSLDLSSILCVISNSPKLEKIKITMCWNHYPCLPEETFKKLLDLQDYNDLKLDNFKELAITKFQDCDSWMKFVKLVMGRSPMLKKATIELCSTVSADREVEMIQDLQHMPFSLESPTLNFIIRRPKS